MYLKYQSGTLSLYKEGKEAVTEADLSVGLFPLYGGRIITELRKVSQEDFARTVLWKLQVVITETKYTWRLGIDWQLSDRPKTKLLLLSTVKVSI